MKLALQKGEIDMAFQSFTPTEITSLPEAEGSSGLHRSRRPHPLPRVQRDARADEQPCRADGDRLPDAAPGDRDARVSRPGEAAVLDGAGRLPRSHRRVRDAVRSEPEPGEGEGGPAGRPASRRRSRSRSGGRRRTTATRRRTSTPRSSAASRRDGVFKVTLKSAEWAQYSARARDAVQRLPARLVPGLPGRRELPRALLPLRHLHRRAATTARRWRS